MKKSLFTLMVSVILGNCSEAATTAMAPVTGFAQAFLYEVGIPNGTITVLETGQQTKTDKNGHFGPILYPVGKPITLIFEKFGYKTTQSATVIVPAEGLQGPYNNITFQIPSMPIFYVMKAFMSAKIDEESCHVTTTVTAYHKTLHDLPQGEIDAQVVLEPAIPTEAFYFGIFKNGPLKNKTSPFSKELKQTSEDGGAAFFNLPPRDEPYTLSAAKAGIVFTKTQFLCRKGMFINLSPPYGPMVMK